MCTDEEVVEGIRLLAECEGIFAETAGGVTVACAKKLIASGAIPRDESVVLCITGHGLKTQEAITGKCGEPRLIKPSLREFEEKIYNPDAAICREPLAKSASQLSHPSALNLPYSTLTLIPTYAKRPHPHPAPQTDQRPRSRPDRRRQHRRNHRQPRAEPSPASKSASATSRATSAAS